MNNPTQVVVWFLKQALTGVDKRLCFTGGYGFKKLWILIVFIDKLNSKNFFFKETSKNCSKDKNSFWEDEAHIPSGDPNETHVSLISFP